MKAKNLKLIARSKDDLSVISAHLQDSIANLQDIAHLWGKRNLFHILLIYLQL